MNTSEYTVEREFLNKISIEGMIRNIIIKHQTEICYNDQDTVNGENE